MRNIVIIIFITITAIIAFSCRGTQEHPQIVEHSGKTSDVSAVVSLLQTDSVTRWEVVSMETPALGKRIPDVFSEKYEEAFNDSNYIHWEGATQIGITPIRDTRGHWMMDKPLEKVTPCADFYVEKLDYSYPYLVPKAAFVLHEIGRRFKERVKDEAGADYRIKVTSVLRTPESIRRLQRVNKNSVDSSVHQLATTFDISYSNFICDDLSVPCHPDDLKAVLASVLSEMREEGKCNVKHEAKQPCFHISARDF